jgi:hypothetical protein
LCQKIKNVARLSKVLGTQATSSIADPGDASLIDASLTEILVNFGMRTA